MLVAAVPAPVKRDTAPDELLATPLAPLPIIIAPEMPADVPVAAELKVMRPLDDAVPAPLIIIIAPPVTSALEVPDEMATAPVVLVAAPE